MHFSTRSLSDVSWRSDAIPQVGLDDIAKKVSNLLIRSYHIIIIVIIIVIIQNMINI
jgi:hypothetical protein